LRVIAIKSLTIQAEKGGVRKVSPSRTAAARAVPWWRSTESIAVEQLFQKLKTSGRALPEDSEVYHKVELRLLETKRPTNDFDGYLKTIIHE
jgi:hypothetical protein